MNKQVMPHKRDRAKQPWHPIALVRVHVDALDLTEQVIAQPGDRIWVEIIKQGQVVGLVEANADKDGIPRPVIERIHHDFANSPLSFAQAVPDVDLPTASVVIPTICREPAQLVRTIESVLNLDYPNFDVLVVDNRTSPEAPPTPELPQDQRIRVLRQMRPGISAARNLGIDHATGDFLAFTDDDAEVDRGWLRAIGSRFTLSPEVDAIGGLVLPKELRTQPQLWFEEFYGGFTRSFESQIMNISRCADDPMFPYDPGRFGAGNNIAIRSTTFQRVGKFDELLGTGTPARGGEDLAMFMKIVFQGGTVAFEPAALVRHAHRTDAQGFMKQVFGYGTGLSAMYTSLIFHDVHQLPAMIRRVPLGIRLLAKPRDKRSPSSSPSYPLRAYFQQLLGMSYGPIAYLVSTLAARNLG